MELGLRRRTHWLAAVVLTFGIAAIASMQDVYADYRG